MALLTVRAHLAAMNVGVAVGTLGSHVAEHQTGMALFAGHIHVHAAQGILRPAVIEIG